ncbi:hypothetical protein [African swine fever virus]|nr:hypothetical protein [African swine fever virus]UNZ12379.1 hypothetical protein [African swine fever virus]
MPVYFFYSLSSCWGLPYGPRCSFTARHLQKTRLAVRITRFLRVSYNLFLGTRSRAKMTVIGTGS